MGTNALLFYCDPCFVRFSKSHRTCRIDVSPCRVFVSSAFPPIDPTSVSAEKRAGETRVSRRIAYNTHTRIHTHRHRYTHTHTIATRRFLHDIFTSRRCRSHVCDLNCKAAARDLVVAILRIFDALKFLDSCNFYLLPLPG